MDEETKRGLIRLALEARENAYAPYSGFAVGAAVLTSGGRMAAGCNVENASYPVGICAEKGAVSAAIAAYGNGVSIAAVAIAGGPAGKPPEGVCPPCGSCRQFLSEFSRDGTMKILLAKSMEDYQEYTIRELLPHGFTG